MSRKGPDFEREFCPKLSLWWTQDQPEPSDSVFWRTANSGGRATTRRRKGLQSNGQYGDVGTSDPAGLPLLRLVTIELKKGYNQHSCHNILDQPGDKVQMYQEWFDKTDATSHEAQSLSWLVVAKRDKRNALVFMPTQLAHALGAHRCWRVARGPTGILVYPRTKSDQYESVTVVTLADFFHCVTPGVVREILKEHST
jgi:hypothetical protein